MSWALCRSRLEVAVPGELEVELKVEVEAVVVCASCGGGVRDGRKDGNEGRGAWNSPAVDALRRPCPETKPLRTMTDDGRARVRRSSLRRWQR